MFKQHILNRDRACAIDGCTTKRLARQWCCMHYQRWRQHGDPTKTLIPTLAERFWAKVNQAGPTAVHMATPCWLWTASVNGAGYGKIADGAGRLRGAHVIAHELVNGPIPDGHDVDHACYVKACVNPAHLEAVTRLENVHRWMRHTGRRP